jgi:hypothetical protein
MAIKVTYLLDTNAIGDLMRAIISLAHIVSCPSRCADGQ